MSSDQDTPFRIPPVDVTPEDDYSAPNGEPGGATDVGSLHTSPPWSRTAKAIFASTALILLALAVYRFREFIAPICTAIILAYLLHPLINWVQRKLTLKRGPAVLIVYLVIILLLIGGGFALVIASAQQIGELIVQMPRLTQNAIILIQDSATSLWTRAFVIGPFEFNPAETLQEVNPRELVTQITGLIQPFLSRGTTLASWFAQTALRVIGLSLLVFALSIYVARDFPRFGQVISDFAHQPGYRQDADRLLADFARIWNAYLRGQVILALVIGVVVTVTLAALGVNNALGLGALAGILEFLPIIGPIFSTVTAILVAAFQNEPFFGLNPLWRPVAVGIAMLLIQQIENNVLVPRIVGKALDLHPLITMVAVLMGASLGGILGAILAAPVVATLKLLGSYGWRKLLDLPPFADMDGRPHEAGVRIERPAATDSTQTAVAKENP